MSRIEPLDTVTMAPHIKRLIVVARACVLEAVPDAEIRGQCVAHMGALLVSALILLGDVAGQREAVTNAAIAALHASLAIDREVAPS